MHKKNYKYIYKIHCQIINKHLLKQKSIDENQMENKNKLVIIFIICITISALIITNYFLTIKDDSTQDKVAMVTFFPPNNSSVLITCEIASTPKELSKGLMNRQELPEDKGMLFVYENEQNLSFWMKNTLIPLDIIFLDKEGIILNIESADVESNISDDDMKRYYSSNPAKFVIEINQGLSKLYGIKEGTKTNIEFS